MLNRIFAIIALWSSLLLIGQAATVESDFQLFWDGFRSAVEHNDKVKIAEMTHFPLETRGPDDSQPIVPVDKSQFLDVIYDQAMNQFEGTKVANGALVDRTLRQAIVEEATLKSNAQQSPNFASVLDMYFKRINGKWKLTRIFLEDPLE